MEKKINQLTVLLETNAQQQSHEERGNMRQVLVDEGICRRSHACAPEHQILERSLISLFDWPGRSLPDAALCALADGLPVEQCFWLHLDPVYLETAASGLVMMGKGILELSRQESSVLLAELQAYFSGTPGIELVGNGERWYVRTDKNPKIECTNLSAALGREVQSGLPHGEQNLYWRNFMNECSMLLFQSPLNQLRESEAKLPVNSVWLWGQGALPNAPPAVFDLVVSNSHLLRGLAQHTGCESLGTEQFSLAGLSADKKKILLHYHHDEMPSTSTREYMLSIVRQCLRPLRQALDNATGLKADLIIPGVLTTPLYATKPWYWF